MNEQERLEAYIAHSDIIYIDACSLRAPGMPMFYDNVKDVLRMYKKQLILRQKVWGEIKKYKDIGNDEAIRAEKYLQKLFYHELLKLEQAESYEIDHADHGIIADFTKYYVSKRMLLITNDYNLAMQVLENNNSKAVHSKYKVHAAKITESGYLKPYSQNKNNHQNSNIHKKNTTNRPYVPESEKFQLSTEPILDNILPLNDKPQAGSSVYTDSGGVLHLGEQIASGGEGSIYTTDATGYVAKIFTEEFCTSNRRDKLRLMLTKPVKYDGVCWPVAVLNNEKGEFCGYLMPKANGTSLRNVLTKRWITKNSWNKKNLIMICIRILDILGHLQDRNIIIVDYNPNNFLISSDGKVCLVDLDSCQLGPYISPVETKEYTPPEIYQRRDAGEKDFLITLENINYSTAVLLFQILIPGQHPMANVQEEGRTIKEDILNGIFPYRFDDKKIGKPPKGAWQKCWSHLSYSVKEAFWNTFQANEGNRILPRDRYDSHDWKHIMEKYLNNDIDKMAEGDKNALSAIPDSFKKANNVTYGKCCDCDKEWPKEWLDQSGGFCDECAKKIADEFTCSRCGDTFIITNYQKYKKGIKTSKYCHDCYKELQSCYDEVTCKECGRKFIITVEHKEYCDSHNFPLPKRCPDCRKERKNAEYEYQKERTNNYFWDSIENTSYNPVEHLLRKFFDM